MKISHLLTMILIATGCTTKAPEVSSTPEEFKGLKGCFLLYDLKQNKMVMETGDTCHVRYPACSTFKVPLAVMAFDSGVLKNENQVLKWDGQKGFLPQWNRDHNAGSWMLNSVVWFSKRLTPMIGEKRVQKYLSDFEYGNEDLSGGLTEAWLVSPSSDGPALKITPYQQLEFMKKLWTNSLPASDKSMKLTRDITFLENSPLGYKLSGKTGSNFYDKAKKIHLGWFIAHLEKGDEEYIAITNMSDIEPYTGTSFGGMRAKEIMKKILVKKGLW